MNARNKRASLTEFRTQLLCVLYDCRPLALSLDTLVIRIRRRIPEAEKKQLPPEVTYFMDKGYIVEERDTLSPGLVSYRLHASGVDYLERQCWRWLADREQE